METDLAIENTTEEKNNERAEKIIKPLGSDIARKICSGQTIVSLSMAIKELIENSIDAGATRIDITLQDYGVESIEVSDNGSGVLHENYQALTLKHYTSKITEFADLEKPSTFGFRGEALSSLCALSNFQVITKHHSEVVGHKIAYDHSGRIISQTPTSRTPGTTVILENLFAPLPVRRKEFVKKHKSEFAKMCQILQAYCLVCTGVRFNCTNRTPSGAKITVLSTEGSDSVKDNIISIFGIKDFVPLIDVPLKPADEDLLNEFNIGDVEDVPPFTFEFIVSTVTHGSGRSSSDRQFCYVNSRPCELTKVAKMINGIYKQFNGKQYPFVYLNVKTELAVDVNVTPDKRQIFFEKEKYLLATIKSSLLDAFKSIPATYKMHNLETSRMIKNGESSMRRSFSSPGPGRGVKRVNNLKNSLLDIFKKRSKTEASSGDDDSFSDETANTNISNANTSENVALDILLKTGNEYLKEAEEEEEEEEPSSATSISTNKNLVTKTKETNMELEIITDRAGHKSSAPARRRRIGSNFTLDKIKESLRSSGRRGSPKKKGEFSKIAPENNEKAEEELTRQIFKGDFKRMSIVGQFNLGFVIARLDDDLFIIDQHAADEKYNFERLQDETVLQKQQLLCPKPLELTSIEEDVLMENEEIFNKNGFNFKIDASAPPTKRISLTSIPMSKNIIFGKDDINEMLCMLRESVHVTTCRPSRVRAMFASRACRKSVMVGTALTGSQMRRLVDHMGEAREPWNCPHGRPTMRHLITLDATESR